LAKYKRGIKNCPTCNVELPLHAKFITENDKKFCDYCISDPRFNPTCLPAENITKEEKNAK